MQVVGTLRMYLLLLVFAIVPGNLAGYYDSDTIPLLHLEEPTQFVLHCNQKYLFKLKESDFEPNSIYEVQFSMIGSVSL